ncbi:erythrocyte membrane-associated antigen [Cryptosporidium bovis]|uniref:erythrocyte membrane-associated antigen n=1 Tax=Cryptosporidium bovis TaxID=310047 RepID=UPI00351A05FC|nr:erythrocyte membrane-associated antigen [Cryptosporidium bovis]
MYDDAYSVFQIYDFKICDSFLLQEISSNWVAVFDLSSTCLSVPPFLFTRITKWLPLECPSNSDYLNNIESQNTHNSTALPYSSLCTVKETPLPIISFKLKQSGIYYMNNNGTEFDDNEYIYIHLDDYLISYNNKNYLCLLNSTQSLMGKNTYIPVDDDFSYNYYSTSLSSSNNPPILFGSLFLKSYGVTIDYSHNKIGFYQKFKYHSTKNDTYGNLNVNSNCPTKKMCIGDSTYSPSLNECIPPDCSEWFSYELDRDTNKCVVSSIYPFLISLAIIILVFFEMHVMYLKQFILDKSNSIIGSN